MPFDFTECTHNFQYQGKVYEDVASNMPGSYARHRYYEDRYFCTKCLQVADLNRTQEGNSYGEPKYGASRK